MSKYSIKLFIGMDLGDKKDQICVIDHDGSIVHSTSIPNTIMGLIQFFDRFDIPQEVLVAMETGTHSPWISHLLNARGFRVLA